MNIPLMTPGFAGVLVGFLSFCWNPCLISVEADRGLNSNDPFYVDRHYPKLTTPQWVGEAGVEAVVILAIDDLRTPDKFETYLRPIINRLKRIDGRAPVSIYCNSFDPLEPQFQVWLQEGLSLEVHTLSHPCPLLAKGDFSSAQNTVFGGIDLLNRIPNNRAVAYRMPCCDSINSPSPRFYSEIFPFVSEEGQFLEIDSSVMCLLTSDDPELPRSLVLDENQKERFTKYVPFPSFTTTIENYPYPYVINDVCWEFPAMAPSDWEAQNLHGVNHETTVEDWKRALDLTVKKQGVFTWIFHPHGWIRNDQVNDFIDYSEEKYGRRVLFLTFKEAAERLRNNLLMGHGLRRPDGKDAGNRLMDINRDGFLDVVLGGEEKGTVRIWSEEQEEFRNYDAPLSFQKGADQPTGLKHGVFWEGGPGAWFYRDGDSEDAWVMTESGLESMSSFISELRCQGKPVTTVFNKQTGGVLVHDVDQDGVDELIVGYPGQHGVLKWNKDRKTWEELPYVWPHSVDLVDEQGKDAGVRFADLNGDGWLDLMQSNETGYAAYIFIPEWVLGFQAGWSRLIMEGDRSDEDAIPAFVRSGEHRDNGAWFAKGHVWVQNEDTAHLPDLVQRKAFQEILLGNRPKPKSVHEALTTFQLDEAYEITCVAAEPLVEDPVAFEWCTDGFLWVAEMRDYPLGVDETGAPGGRIKRLQDVDRDGVYDESVVFLDEIPFPSGLYPWKNGIWISAAPHVFFASDLDGDGRADLVRRLYSGFGEGNQQHRVNGFAYGLDHQLHGANGDSGGNIRSLWSDEVWNLRRRDFCFDPDTGSFQTLEGQTQFGRVRDDWGNWFGNNNPNWLWHYHFPERYANRVPNVSFGSNKIQLAADVASKKVDQIAPSLQRYNDIGMRGHVTSACGSTIYRDTLLFDDGFEHAFISEPVHNLVRHFVLKRDGVSFTAERPSNESNREFLASTDPWFRPAMLKTGPDGGLYVADMYRLVIEHTEWIPDDVEQFMNTRAGTDKGRIYRVVPKSYSAESVIKLHQKSPSEWTDLLEDTNGWKRDMAQRLLIDHQGVDQVDRLRTLAVNSANALAQVHAMWTLHQLEKLEQRTVIQALDSPNPQVRRNALMLWEDNLDEYVNTDRGLEYLHVMPLLQDPEIEVRMQAVLSLGSRFQQHAVSDLMDAMHQEANNPYLKHAFIVASNNYLRPMTSHALMCPSCQDSGLLEPLMKICFDKERDWISIKLGQVLRGKMNQIPEDFPDDISNPKYLSEKKLVQRAFPPEGVEALNIVHRYLAVSAGLDKQVEDLFYFDQLLQLAGWALVAKNQVSEERRLIAFECLWRLSEISDWTPWLNYLLSNRSGFGKEAKKSLLEIVSKRTEKLGNSMEWMETIWNSSSLNERRILLSIVLKRSSWTKRFLNTVATGQFDSHENKLIDATLTPEMTISLRNITNSELKPEVEDSLKRRSVRLGMDRIEDQNIQQRFEKIAKQIKNTSHGQELFQQNCGVCHVFQGEGSTVGPDLNALNDRSGLALLTAILNPNDAIEQTYLAYELVLKDETEWTVLLGDENAEGIEITTTTGEKRLILHEQIESLRPSSRSLMPAGWGDAMSDQDLADLISYLQTQTQ